MEEVVIQAVVTLVGIGGPTAFFLKRYLDRVEKGIDNHTPAPDCVTRDEHARDMRGVYDRIEQGLGRLDDKIDRRCDGIQGRIDTRVDELIKIIKSNGNGR